ncbi:hypothetical protein ACQUJT_25240 [Ralstonia pseudosolanacearum]
MSRLGFADGKSRQYLYENSNYPSALTGVIDENGRRASTTRYDAEGRAVETEQADGLENYKVSYSVPGKWRTEDVYDAQYNGVTHHHYWEPPQGFTLTSPNGATADQSVANVKGTPKLATVSRKQSLNNASQRVAGMAHGKSAA